MNAIRCKGGLGVSPAGGSFATMRSATLCIASNLNALTP